MHETLRTGDFGHRYRGMEGVTVNLAIGKRELMGTKSDAIGAVRERGIKTGRRRSNAARILHGTVLLLDADEIERRIGEHLRDPQGLRAAVDLRRLADLERLSLPHADRVAAEQQRLGRLGGGINEDRA